MVAYAFPADAHEDLASGIKTFSLQPPRSDRSRHARAGEPLQLRTGSAANGHVVAAQCIVRATIHLAADGVRRVLDERRLAAAPEADGILARFLNAENGAANAERDRDRMAVGLGFTDYADLWREVVRSGKGQVKRTGVYAWELVGWRRWNG